MCRRRSILGARFPRDLEDRRLALRANGSARLTGSRLGIDDTFGTADNGPEDPPMALLREELDRPGAAAASAKAVRGLAVDRR